MIFDSLVHRRFLAVFLILCGFPFAGPVSATMIERSSVGPVGVEGNRNSGGGHYYGPPAISGDGRYVAFASWASNLIGAGLDTNGVADIYVRDHVTGLTSRISVDELGEQNDRDSFWPSISRDGRYITFQTTGSLDSRDVNGELDVYLVDRDTDDDGIFDEPSPGSRTVALVSLNAAGFFSGGGASEHGSISRDGALVAFESSAADLVSSGDTNGHRDIFLCDWKSETTTLVSVDSSEAQSDGASFKPWISADGLFVAFETMAANLTSDPDGLGTDIIMRDLTAGTTEKVSVAGGGAAANGTCVWPSLSEDGRYVCFLSKADNLLGAGGTGMLWHSVFVRDRLLGITKHAAGSGFYNLFSARISGDGRYVVFDTEEDLVAWDLSYKYDVYLVDRDTGEYQICTLDDEGVQPFCGSNCTTGPPAIASDGTHTAFGTSAADLVPGDTNGRNDIFRRKIGKDLVVLTGDTVGSVGATASYGFSGGPHSGTFGFLLAFKKTGQTLLGHSIGIGPVYSVLSLSTLDGSGMGTYTTPVLPPILSGLSLHFEVLTKDASTQYYDSNEVTLSVL